MNKRGLVQGLLVGVWFKNAWRGKPRRKFSRPSLPFQHITEVEVLESRLAPDVTGVPNALGPMPDVFTVTDEGVQMADPTKTFTTGTYPVPYVSGNNWAVLSNSHVVGVELGTNDGTNYSWLVSDYDQVVGQQAYFVMYSPIADGPYINTSGPCINTPSGTLGCSGGSATLIGDAHPTTLQPDLNIGVADDVEDTTGAQIYAGQFQPITISIPFLQSSANLGTVTLSWDNANWIKVYTDQTFTKTITSGQTYSAADFLNNTTKTFYVLGQHNGTDSSPTSTVEMTLTYISASATSTDQAKIKVQHATDVATLQSWVQAGSAASTQLDAILTQADATKLGFLAKSGLLLLGGNNPCVKWVESFEASAVGQTLINYTWPNLPPITGKEVGFDVVGMPNVTQHFVIELEFPNGQIAFLDSGHVGKGLGSLGWMIENNHIFFLDEIPANYTIVGSFF